MGNSITANKNLVIQTYNTADGTLPTSAVLTSGLTSGTAYTTWDVPENYNAAALDVVLGGTATVSVTGASGTVALTADKYQPMVLLFTGTLTASVIYTIPSGVGGTWVVRNSTTGSFTITLSSLTAGASATFAVPQDGLPYTVSLIAVSGGGFYIGTITDSSITTAKIADANVTTDKIANGNVTEGKIGTGAVTVDKLGAAAVTGAKLSGAQTGTAPVYGARAWVNFNGVPATGTYGRSGTLVSVALTAHGMTTGQIANLTFSAGTGGTATSGSYAVTVVDANNFTIVDSVSGSITGSPSVTRNNYIRASGNVSSITDNGVGDYTVNFSTAMPDANYVVSGLCQRPDTNNDIALTIPYASLGGAYSTSAVRLVTTTMSASWPGVDASVVSVTIHR